MAMCFELNYFHKDQKKSSYRQERSLEMQAATRVEILWGSSLSHFQRFQEIVADGVIFSLKHRAIVHRTLLKAITDVFMRIFWNTYTKNLKVHWKFLCRYFSGSAQKRKDNLRFRSFPEAFANVCLFLKRYLRYITLRYVTSIKTPRQKCFQSVLSV